MISKISILYDEHVHKHIDFYVDFRSVFSLCVRFVYVILMRSEGGVGDSGPEIQCMYGMQQAGLMQFGPRFV